MKPLHRREIKQDYPKQSKHLKSATKKYYVMEQLNDYILDAIITLRQKKKQPKEDSILNILTSKNGIINKSKIR